ncbi:hypothetical protein N7471_007456 [Penicillium samsonianum]|uniref:uncharacterized protein n=1 Tax=Penicillium samsonianum TaxID=1882272 RepID=UPI0025479FF9|nr:uncharacterized protein N7471_007456 [Penicillium samsonianum]KAJ6132241.1 hypothetical protein N7471_007456 [Penicillium samsonianum]
MPASFLSLPAELRNEIYMYLLVRSEPIDPWNGGHELVPNLLSTNTKILHEARSLLYGDNCFDLSRWESEIIAQFLDTIGFINASYLQCIRIDFPTLRELEYKVNLEVDSLRILEKIQCHCINLEKVITTSKSTTAMENQLDSFDSPKICEKALALVDARFREISSLQEIVIEVYEEGPSLDLRRKMRSRGWILNVVEEPVEEVKWNFHTSWDGLEDDEYVCDDDYNDYFDVDDYNDDYDDDYDIDNDSDFWRRAAD